MFSFVVLIVCLFVCFFGGRTVCFCDLILTYYKLGSSTIYALKHIIRIVIKETEHRERVTERKRDRDRERQTETETERDI